MDKMTKQTVARRRPRRLLYRALLGLAGTGIGLAAGEIMVRVIGVGPRVFPVHRKLFTFSDNATLRYELVPNADDGEARINVYGFRGSDLPRRKRADAFRIACLGDSVCFGYGVKQNETFSARLEQFLNRYFGSPQQTFQVLNFGVTGYNIAQVAEMFRQRVVHFEPDLVLYAYCLNDPQAYSAEFDALESRLNSAEKTYREHLWSQTRRFALRSRLYALARYSFDAMTPTGQRFGHRGGTDPQFAELAQNTGGDYFARIHRDSPGRMRLESGLTSIARTARNHRIVTHLVLFPVFIEPETYPLAPIHDQVAALAKSRHLHVLDLAPLYHGFDGDGFMEMHVDELHPSADGHAFAALAMLRDLLNRGSLPVTARDIDRLTSAPEPVGAFARLLMQFPPSEITAGTPAIAPDSRRSTAD